MCDGGHKTSCGLRPMWKTGGVGWGGGRCACTYSMLVKLAQKILKIIIKLGEIEFEEKCETDSEVASLM